MVPILRSVALLSISFACALALAHGTARADCGASQIKALAPQFLKAESALPNQSVQSLFVGGYDSGMQRLSELPNNALPCPDDPAPTQFATRTIPMLWHYGLEFQAYANLATYLRSGGSIPQYPHECAAPTFAGIRYNAMTRWIALGRTELQVHDLTTGQVTKALASVPYGPHVLSLWASMAKAIDLPLPAIGSEMDTINAKYAKEQETALAHLPSGVNCPLSIALRDSNRIEIVHSASK